MHRLRDRATHRLALILAGAAWIAAAALTAAEVPEDTITVRVYQAAGLPSSLEQQALAEAEVVLRTALVDVRWRRCSGPNRSSVCDQPLRPCELLLRIAREGTARQNRSATLGDARVIRRAGCGVLASVYVDHVASLAKAAGAEIAVLLGRVAAHELGHLIMNTSAHTRRGLMRPNWTLEEIRQNHAADWTFTKADIATMRRPGVRLRAPSAADLSTGRCSSPQDAVDVPQ
ncbi:MAG TPA: hypothetical protein VJ813_18590 [Vicinamibacterales bacterium]|nr:hypothetical protein [Vicinamibacterales bacterium]